MGSLNRSTVFYELRTNDFGTSRKGGIGWRAAHRAVALFRHALNTFEPRWQCLGVGQGDARSVMTSDAELISKSLHGDDKAFVELIGRHEGAIGAYLARRVGREAAEDLLGEVWVAAFESRRTYDRSFKDARPWLYGVALNRCGVTGDHNHPRNSFLT